MALSPPSVFISVLVAASTVPLGGRVTSGVRHRFSGEARALIPQEIRGGGVVVRVVVEVVLWWCRSRRAAR